MLIYKTWQNILPYPSGPSSLHLTCSGASPFWVGLFRIAACRGNVVFPWLTHTVIDNKDHIKKPTTSLSEVGFSRNRDQDRNLVACDTQRKGSSEKVSERSRMSPGMRLSRDMLSPRIPLQPNPKLWSYFATQFYVFEPRMSGFCTAVLRHYTTCFTLFCFTDVACFKNWRQGPPPKKITTRSIMILTLLLWSRTKPTMCSVPAAMLPKEGINST